MVLTTTHITRNALNTADTIITTTARNNARCTQERKATQDNIKTWTGLSDEE